ncbi:hypothetical protein A2755_01365 [Candidatus Wolfebacteria bacterium RIFCSPHIGHO2_01_FULL_48_22]|uniref:DUF5667 domain-containing protein n=2 Tax=Candidatus Wolfeibacteriota TaxID=1752735 RepID=A0A1F8DUT7_9BACT|nr:MAG: hypothetical protein A2755_01365 [Candidatus Wolfebacteria bacterium RIFCSPHIGHO2_01_FULL_48_22]OGM93900.1 MAG: hypothetical protein A2935_03420 [Candidatus Wolfebacteria bacterium RIFCSPLOWO2_01_FULL_47_17b]
MKPLKYIITSLIIAILASIPVVDAATDIETKIAETKATIQKLLEVKDDTSLPVNERQQLELQLKKSITLNIIDIAASQIQEMRQQMDKVNFPDSEDWGKVKTYVYNSLDAYGTFYKESRISLEASDITLEEVRGIAQEIETKKESEIDPFLQKTANISTAFGISNIIKRADERRWKVLDDVNKIYTQKLTDNRDLRESFNKAADAISEAKTLNNKSKEIMLNRYIPKEEPIEVTTATTTATTTVSEVIDTENAEDAELKEIIKQSAEHIRQAYSIFLEMSITVKEYLDQ